MMENYTTPKAGKLMKFMWECAGGDTFLLERATYSDQVKYFCMGGIVLATGIMASLSGGYAFYTIFSPKTDSVLNKMQVVNATEIPIHYPTVILSVVFGILWGLMIYNIDRFIVTSTGKGDGTEAITMQEFKSSLPRIIMGCIIAISISKPVEIRMFKTEIDLEIQKEQEKEKANLISLAEVNFKKGIAQTEKNLGKIQMDIDALQKLQTEYSENLSNEISGKSGNGADYGPRATQFERLKKETEAKIAELKNTSEFKKAEKDKAELEDKYKQDIDDAKRKGASLDGLLIRIKKAHEVAGTTITLFITLLFLAIELTPIFFKMMLIKSPYDYLYENRNEMKLAENGIEVRYDFYKDKEGLERHLVINHEADKQKFEKVKIAEIQKELTQYAVDKYKEREKEKIDENPELYIKEV
ncbi:DUF4407 domain-containing protein [Candidatus Kaistella beijingensis]|uniref:DUF4407 domain-containing protein n=1 Tax=Candidatus Kaistella beijingensis TaxID=2820270 RepID=UPI001CC3546E|nr:DUF4407 domain-containing protein [Candidatus Kaistella beijingensis]UBB89886.1 DUF4407 domain-containing protein [Candidatus Kaistella beijingensis]